MQSAKQFRKIPGYILSPDCFIGNVTQPHGISYFRAPKNGNKGTQIIGLNRNSVANQGTVYPAMDHKRGRVIGGGDGVRAKPQRICGAN